MRAGRLLLGVVVCWQSVSWTAALETDQFYAWNRPLEDATDAINAEVNAGIEEALHRVNARGACSCEAVERAIHDRYAYAIISPIEIWAMKTSLVDRVPAGAADEKAYRRAWIYGTSSPLDPIHWMPPSSTIELAGVRIGIDKLGHFFGDGETAHRRYQRALDNGAADEAAMTRALRASFTSERTIWGEGTSGVLSLADLEADYQGLMFYRGLCGGTQPMLELASGRWRIAKPFDFRDWVGPAWDESWQPSVYTRSRWAKVRPVMRRYCERLQDPDVRSRRAAYAARDHGSPMATLIHELVAFGKLADPRPFSIEAVCAGSYSSPSTRNSSEIRRR